MKLHAAYIAGFLDGDGTITATLIRCSASPVHYAKSFVPHVEFSNQNLQVLEAIRETLGCGYINAYIQGHGTGCYRLSVPVREAERVIRIILPYLVIKKQQAELVLQGIATKKRQGGPRVSQEVQDLRQLLLEQIQTLNRRDGKAYRKNWVNSGKPSYNRVTVDETIPSQASEGKGSEEGVTTRSVSPNNNPVHERPARKGRYSLNTVVIQ